MIVEWCDVCHAQPAVGVLTVLLDEETKETIPLNACEDCVTDPTKVEFIK